MNGLAEEVRQQLAGMGQAYHRLILIVGPSGAGKTAALKELAETLPAPYVNLSVVLSQRLLDYTSKVRPLRVPQLLVEITELAGGSIVLIDNTAVLFDTALRQDPLRCLQSVSRNCTVVATWNGTADGRTLTYALPGHPEYRRYQEPLPVVVNADRSIASPTIGESK